MLEADADAVAVCHTTNVLCLGEVAAPQSQWQSLTFSHRHVMQPVRSFLERLYSLLRAC